MGKYKRALDDIYSIFDSTAWKANNIPTFPENYKGEALKFIVVNCVFSGGAINGFSISGVILVDIYTEANKGPLEAITIADLLDELLNEKAVYKDAKFNTQFFNSSLVSVGVDSGNPTLYRHTYSIPFSHYGAY